MRLFFGGGFNFARDNVVTRKNNNNIFCKKGAAIYDTGGEIIRFPVFFLVFFLRSSFVEVIVTSGDFCT